MKKRTRRKFLVIVAACVVLPWLGRSATAEGEARARPNVVLIMTDDQGYGDLGCHGNDKLKTPNLDRIAREGVEFTQFLVCPVCSPTRACLMTGRYNYRTAVVDTYLGRSMMHADEVTLAEMLRSAGYRTGIFGKWHLGDNYPLRAIDQGFEEALVHNGGGIGQPSDPPGNHYFDPVLQHNGKPEKHKGYSTDIFTDGAIRFIKRHRRNPFFVYLATNCPHSPFEVADAYARPFEAMGLDERTSKIYGMIVNIDENVGRLLKALETLRLAENTIVVFLTDNGPNGARYNAGLRAHKGSVYEGGIRTAFFARWPARLRAGARIDRLAAHIDIAPTLLEACGAPRPAGVEFDGVSLLTAMAGDTPSWPERTIYLQWHRGDEPEPFRASAARGERYKLVNGKELYDLRTDPGETKDIAKAHPEIVARMRAGYERWFRDVSATRGYAPPRIHLGAPQEPVSILTRQDWRGPRAGWGAKSLGHWEVRVTRSGSYEIRLRFGRLAAAGEAHFKLGSVTMSSPLEEGATSCVFPSVSLPEGPGRLEAWVKVGEEAMGVHYVDVDASRDSPG